MTTTLIPRDTLMAGLIAKSAAAADAEVKPTAAQEAIANADAHLSNAVLPTYTELLETLRKVERELAYHASTRRSRELPGMRNLLARHDKTTAGNFGA